MSKMCVEIDCGKLAASNKIIHGWLAKLNLNRTAVYDLVVQVCENSGELWNAIPSELKEALSNDMHHFQYVKSIENHFLAHNQRMIASVVNACGIVNMNDEHESMGMLSLRRSLYYYMDSDVSLASYCFRGIKQEVIKVERQKKMKKNRVWNTTAKLDYNDEEISKKLSYEEANTEEPETVSEALSQTYKNGYQSDLLGKIADAAGLNDSERNLLLSMSKEHATKGGWVDDFLVKTGSTMSKQNVYQRKDALMAKLRQLVTKQGIRLFR